MATVKAVIRKNKVNNKGECVVYCRYGHNQKTVDISSGIKIQANSWSENKQKVNNVSLHPKTKANQELIKTLTKSDAIINAKIANQIALIKSISNQLLLEEKEPDVHTVKSLYMKDHVENKDSNQDRDIILLYDRYVKTVNKSDGTKKNYTSTLYHLKEYGKKTKRKILVDDITFRFYDAFVHFLLTELKNKFTGEVGLSDNTVGSTIKNLKVFMGYLQKRGYQISNDYKEFKVKKETKGVIFLTEDEINKLINKKYKSDYLERVRDVFVFNCFTGLRYSDLKRLSKSHITEENCIHMQSHKPQQTQDIFVPLTKTSISILEKYDYKLPIISEQKYNDYIKTACQKAGITSLVGTHKVKSGNKKYYTKSKFELITSHIAIKTFISMCGKKGI